MKVAVLTIVTVVVAGAAWARDADKTIFSSPTYYYTAPTSPGTTPTPAPTPTPTPSPTPTPTSLAAPAPLNASTQSNKVLLSWANIANETGYIVERRRHGTTTFSEVAKKTTDQSSHTDILTDTTTTYDYRVRAYSAVNGMTYSDYSNVAFSTSACE